jgi:hypothetical protein
VQNLSELDLSGLRGVLRKGVILLGDSIQPHVACIVHMYCTPCAVKVLNNPLYNLHLALCDFSMPVPLKKVLEGCELGSDKRHSGHGGAVVPGAAKGVVCIGDPSASVSEGCCLNPRGDYFNDLYSCVQNSPCVSFEQTSCTHTCTCMNTQNYNYIWGMSD